MRMESRRKSSEPEGESVEVRLKLKDRYRAAAAHAYETEALRGVNEKLAPLGMHITFTTNNEPCNESRPQGIIVWADAN